MDDELANAFCTRSSAGVLGRHANMGSVLCMLVSPIVNNATVINNDPS